MKHWNYAVAAACFAILGCTNERAPVLQHSDEMTGKNVANMSEGHDDYRRVLEANATDLEASYVVGSKIPATVRIKNHGAPKTDLPPKQLQAQLFPYLTVWVKGKSISTVERIQLPIENRIWIKQGATFERTIDLSEIQIFATPGEYEVIIGHENATVYDGGDWTGILRTNPQTIVIKSE